MQKQVEHKNISNLYGYIRNKRLIETKNKSKKFLVASIECGKDKDLVDVTVFPPYSDPQRAVKLDNEFNEGDFVHVWGNITENYFDRENKSRDRMNYNVRAPRIEWANEEEKSPKAFFDIIGVVKKKSDKGTTVRVTNTYKKKNGEIVKNEYDFLVNEKGINEDVDVEVGCLVQFLGEVHNGRVMSVEKLDGFDPDMGVLESQKGEFARRTELYARQAEVLIDAFDMEEYQDEEDTKDELNVDDIPF